MTPRLSQSSSPSSCIRPQPANSGAQTPDPTSWEQALDRGRRRQVRDERGTRRLRTVVCLLFAASLIGTIFVCTTPTFANDCNHQSRASNALVLAGALPAGLAFLIQFFVAGRHRLIRVVGILSLLLVILISGLAYFTTFAWALVCND